MLQVSLKRAHNNITALTYIGKDLVFLHNEVGLGAEGAEGAEGAGRGAE